MRRLDRYVLSEILGPLGLGFLVYTFLLLMQFLFRSAEMIIRRGVPAGQVGELLLLTLPNIVVLTIPISFLFGILVAVGRLSSDSELVALRSSGVSLFSLYRPILLLSLMLTALNTLLMVFVLPRGNQALQQLRIEIVTNSVARQVEPRVFYEEWEGLILYVFEQQPGESAWKGVFVAEDLPSAENQVTIAERGEVRLDERGERLILHLENAVSHTVDFREPQKYRTSRFATLDRVLFDQFTSLQQARVSRSKGIRELTLGELRQNLENPKLPPQLRNLTRVEIHKKFSIPVACVVFGLLALPLGLSWGRGSHSSGFAISVLVILVYYVMLNHGEEAARVGEMAPWVAMWRPNAVLAAVGLFLLARRNRDKPLLLTRLDLWIRRSLWRSLQRLGARIRARKRPPGRPGRPRGRPGVVLRLPHLRSRFPNLIDRYIMRLFAGVFALVLVSGLAIYVVSDLSERVDDIFNNKITADVVLDYYKYLSLQIVYDISPVAVLVTTLIVFGILSKNNEVTAAKALGVSLYRLALPAVMAGVLVAGMCVVLQARVLPAANARVAQLKDRIKGRPSLRTYRRADRQWLFGQGRYIYNYLRYDSEKQMLRRLQVFEFDDEYALTRRLFSNTAKYLGDKTWLFEKCWVRSFEGREMLSYETFHEPMKDYYPETPDYFESEFKRPDAMNYGELKDYIGEVKASGQLAPELEVELYKKVSLPVASLVMALVALPFSFRLGRRGTLYGIGIGVVLGMVFFALFAFSSTLGETGALPPLLAVWSPSILFSILSGYLLLGVRT